MPEANNNLGVLLNDCRNLEASVECFRKALSASEDFANAQHNNLGNALRDLGQHEEAVSHFHAAFRIRPGFAEVYNNLGIAHHQNGELDAALDCYDRSLENKPDYATARMNRSFTLLTRGEFDKGWMEYEYRWTGRNLGVRTFPQPLWDGSTGTGQTILIYAEQGLGDTIQFIRYAALLKERFARVVFECPQPLVRLLATCPGIDTLISEERDLPEFNAQAPLMRLPGLFRTDLDSIPAPIPYLATDRQRLERGACRTRGLPRLQSGDRGRGTPATPTTVCDPSPSSSSRH